MATGKRILADKSAIKAELRRIASKTRAPEVFQEVETMIDRIFDPETPTYALKISAVTSIFLFGGRLILVPPEKQEAYQRLEECLAGILLSRGYRDGGGIYTYQEHCLMGSTEWEGHAQNPYTPIGILDGKLAIEETRVARRLAVIFSSVDSVYSVHSIKSRLVTASLEPLDDAGVTIRDPRLLDRARLDAALRTLSYAQALDACAIPAQRSMDFPFRRD